VSRELLRVEVRDTGGVFTARQLGREVAAELGLERQDQVRVATALSEIGRELVVADETAVIIFLAGDNELVIRVEHAGPPPASAIAVAGRLMDRAAAEDQAVEIAKTRPAGGLPDIRGARRRLAALVRVPALDELRRQNDDLANALADLQRQKEELLRLNAELEETNQGVMALYGQLSDELEQTNQGVVALYRELEEKSTQLREASEAKNRFWANVSHELRTPLNSVIGLARLLAGPGGGTLDLDQYYQVSLIEGAGTSLLAMVNDLLDTAKAESGTLRVELADIDLPAVLARLHALLRPLTEDRPVGLVVDSSGAPATLYTDEVALTAILRNLLSNGLKYTDSGEVRLSVRPGAGYVEFLVTDTGIGIAAELQEHVFEEFFQVPGTGRSGTGLGLPYARRLAELLGGQLTLVSEPGRGTTVTARLPHGTPQVGSVLIADDDPVFRQVLRGLLDGIAGRVTEVGDGAEALAALDAERADLALIDLRMPGMDGYTLLQRLPVGLPVIVITSMDADDLPAGAGMVLRKDGLTRGQLGHAILRLQADAAYQGPPPSAPPAPSAPSPSAPSPSAPSPSAPSPSAPSPSAPPDPSAPPVPGRHGE
jgi:signal transduction histidine kinase